MNTSAKVLVGGLIAVNLLLVGLLLFRDNSVARARAATAGSSAPVEVERQGGTAFAAKEAAVPVTEPAPAVAVERVVAREVPAEADVVDELESEPAAPGRRAAPRTATRPVERPRAETRSTYPAPERSEPATRDARPEMVATNRPAENPYPVEERYPAAGESRDTVEPARPIETARARPVSPPPPVMVTVPAGTHLGVRLDVALNSRQVRSGDKFEASLAQDLIVDGKHVAGAGDPITGKILEVAESGRVKGREMMQLTLAEVTLAGRSYRVDTSSATFQAEDDHGRDAAVIGGSSVVGAIIGGIAKGGKGAATGAAAGAAAGAGVVLGTKGKPVNLSAGTPLDFTLEQSVRVTLSPREPGHETPGEDEERERREQRESDEPAGISQR